MSKLPRRAFHGALVHSISLTELEVLPSGLLGVDEAGVIAFLDKAVPVGEVAATLKQHGWEGVELVSLKRGEFLCPGLIDTHTHAPQYPNLSFGQQYELLDWLSHVTFPTESKFGDAQYARRTYEGVVQRVINTGTTTCSYYGTLHLTTKILAAICHRKGQRAFVGRCSMDRHALPEYQETSAETSLADTREFVSFVKERCISPTPSTGPDGLVVKGIPAKLATNLVQPILTPRFAISCSEQVLTDLGGMMAKDVTLPLQTHLAENPSEVAFARSLFPFAESYTHIYDHYGLLRNNSILAHCVHLAPEEMELIRSRKAGISHCPTSNFNLRSGTSKVAEMLDRGIKVSLGTDVSGGFGLGILTTLRHASVASKTIVFLERDAPPSQTPPPPISDSKYPAGHFSSRHLSLETLFYLATLGGAEVTCLEDRIGNFLVGKEFDALLVQSGQHEAEPERDANGIAEEGDDDVMRWKESTDPFSMEGYNPAMFVEPEDSIEKVFEKWSCNLCSKTEFDLGIKFQSCSVCYTAKYCSRECQRRDWKQHKLRCTELAGVHSKMEEEAMTSPHDALIFGAFNDFTRGKLYTELSNYFSSVVYQLGYPGPKLTRTHVLCFKFAFDPRQSSKDDRRAQFRLISATFVPQDDLIRLASGKASFVDMLDQFDKSPGKLSGRQEIGPVIGLASVAGRAPGPKPATVITAPLWDTRNAPLPNYHQAGWSKFAASAFAGPIPADMNDVVRARVKELQEEQGRQA